jgi:hypothetical protein
VVPLGIVKEGILLDALLATDFLTLVAISKGKAMELSLGLLKSLLVVLDFVDFLFAPTGLTVLLSLGCYYWLTQAIAFMWL